jgi:hypothetical protein
MGVSIGVRVRRVLVLVAMVFVAALFGWWSAVYVGYSGSVLVVGTAGRGAGVAALVLGAELGIGGVCLLAAWMVDR